MSDYTYPSYITWKVELQKDKDFSYLLGKSETKKLKKTLELLPLSEYQFKVTQVDKQYLAEFIPMYQTDMRQKKHGVIFDVHQKIESNHKKEIRYEAISLLKNDSLIGGMIYSIRGSSVSVAYRSFPHTLDIKLPISCSYAAEHYLVNRAIELDKFTITHGRDRNPFGLNSAIGLADYKLRIGSVPYVSKSKENEFHRLKEYTHDEDSLIFLGTEPAQRITKAVLLYQSNSPAREKNYISLFKQPMVKIIAYQKFTAHSVP